MQSQHEYAGGVKVLDRPLVDPDWQIKTRYSHDEFWNAAYKDLGKRYGLNDIREAK